jgi:hypothetical protein
MTLSSEPVLPAVPAATGGFGHNSGEQPNVIDDVGIREKFAMKRTDFIARVHAFLKGIDIWHTRPKLDADTAERCRDFIAGAKKLLSEAESERKIEKAPYLAACERVDEDWSSIKMMISDVVKEAEPKLKAYLDEIRAQQQREQEAAAKVAEEAREKAAAAAAAAAAATTPSERIIAEQQQRDAERDAKLNDKIANAAPVKVASATGLANAASLRTTWDVELTDPVRAVMHYRNDPEVLELVKKLAKRELAAVKTVKGKKEEMPVIPGVTFKPVEKVAA